MNKNNEKKINLNKINLKIKNKIKVKKIKKIT